MSYGQLTLALRCCLVFAALIICWPAAAFDRLVVYGDSLSATVNCRASNGQLWPEYLLPRLQLQPEQLTNLAVCGAQSQQLEGQLQQYPGGGAADPNALYVIIIGGNDYIRGIASNPAAVPQLVPDVVNRILGAVRHLQAKGARTILVGQLPDLGRVPLGARSGAAGLANQISASHNQQLLAGLGQLVGELHIQILTIDSSGLYNAVLHDPGRFGFVETTRFCQEIPDCKPDQTVFYDNLHPTTAMHWLIAAAIAKILNI